MQRKAESVPDLVNDFASGSPMYAAKAPDPIAVDDAQLEIV